MKKNLYLIAIAFILFSAGCSKEKDTVPKTADPVEGYWSGFYKVNGFTTKYNAAILIRPGGTMRFYELGNETDTTIVPTEYKKDGTWTFTDNVFRFGFSINTNYATGSLVQNAGNTKLNGTYSIDDVITGVMEYQK